MAVRVGIPRGLLYYYYGEIWEEFFRRLGAEPVVSPPTTRDMVEAGGGVDEVCLPVKVFFGHARALADRADFVFMPRLVSAAAGQYSCPKMIGLPDVMASVFPGGPPLIAPTVNLRNGRRGLYAAVAGVGAALGRSALYSLYAWQRTWAGRRREEPGTAAGGGPRVALVGHPYILGDRQVSMDITGKLAALGVDAIPADRVGARAAARAAARLPKNIFWQYCRHLAGAALALLDGERPPDGMIFLTSFACGPDSLIGELLGREAGRRGVPFLLLTLDEHTAEAGFVTRLEAFTDMLRRGGGRW